MFRNKTASRAHFSHVQKRVKRFILRLSGNGLRGGKGGSGHFQKTGLVK
jgi:hypothetical protein